MRDVLTFLAALLIVALTAALAVPPFIDWPAHRSLIDGGLARALGMPVETVGAIDLRLLPTPRIAIERLKLGSPDIRRASFDGSGIEAEMALTPLLSGEIRVLETRMGRAEVKLPTGAGGTWRIPDRILSPAAAGRSLALDGVTVDRLLVTTSDPASGRTEQFNVEAARIQATGLRGPWRASALVAGSTVEGSLGEIGPDGRASLKLAAGGGGVGRPRLDLNGRIELRPGDVGGTLAPRFTGSARLARAATARQADERPLPFTITAELTADGSAVDLASMTVEAGEAPSPVRLTGKGGYRPDEGRLRLALEGRRVDLGLLRSAATADARNPGELVRALAGLPLSLTLKLDGLSVGVDEDLTGVEGAFSLDGDKLLVDRAVAVAPGETRIEGRGVVELAADPVGQGSIRLSSRTPERLVRFLDALGVSGLAGLLDERPLEASADLAVSDLVTSVRGLRVTQGDTVATGTLRFGAADGGRRGRLDAQLALQAVDLGRIPAAGALFDAARRVDYGLVLDARNVVYGTSREGRIAARITTDGPSVVIDRLEVANLAGSEATLSGRISPDGTGRIEGRLKAARAAPLVDLFGRAWLGPAAALVPSLVRDSPLDLTVRSERGGERGGQASAIRTVLAGLAAGGNLDAATTTVEGQLRALDGTVTTERAGSWLGQDTPALRRPARLEFDAGRNPTGRLEATLRANVAGLRIETSAPLRLAPTDDRIAGIGVKLVGQNMGPFLSLLGPETPVFGRPDIVLDLTYDAAEAFRISGNGRVAGADVALEVAGPTFAELTGTATLSRLSLPWLAGAFILQGPVTAPAGAIWPAARFGARPPLPFGGRLTVTATTLELGGGLLGQRATLQGSLGPEGLAFKDAAFGFAGGRVRANVSFARQGGLASLIGEGTAEDVELPGLLGAPIGGGRVGGTLRFGGSGETMATLAANLGGAGTLTLDGLRLDGADPAGVGRVAAQALRGDDPLAGPRLGALLATELSRGSLPSGPARAGATLIGGALRISPLRLESAAGSWQGTASLDLRDLGLDLRGALQPVVLPAKWPATTPPPYVTLAWAGPLGRPVRSIDPGPMVNALAAVVLARELERIELFEADAAERARLNARVEMDRQRRLAAEEAARQARLREEAAERARQEAERARLEAERARAAGDGGPLPPERRPPIDIRPPAQGG